MKMHNSKKRFSFLKLIVHHHSGIISIFMFSKIVQIKVIVMLTCCIFILSGAVSGFGLDYLPAAASSAASDTSWHQTGPTGSSWTNQESPMEESSSTVLLDSLKVLKPSCRLFPYNPAVVL